MHEFSIPDTVSGFFGLKEYICTINKEINIYIYIFISFCLLFQYFIFQFFCCLSVIHILIHFLCVCVYGYVIEQTSNHD